MATQTLGELLVQLQLNAAQFQAGLVQAQIAVGQFTGLAGQQLGGTLPANILKAQTATTGLAGSLGTLAQAFGRGAALGTIISTLGGLGFAAAEAERQEYQLAQAVASVGQSLDAMQPHLDAAIDRAKQLGFTGGGAREALALLTVQTGSATEAIRRLAIAEDIARLTGMDLYQAARTIGRLTEDNINILGRWGIAVRKGASEEEALATIQARVAGQADQAARGQLAAAERFANAWKDATERIGGFLNEHAAGVMAATIAFNQLGVSAIFRVGGITAAVEGLREMAVAARNAAAGLLLMAAPLALIAAGVAGVLALAYALGKLSPDKSGALAQFADSVDKLGGIKDQQGLEGVLRALLGIEQQSRATFTGSTAAVGGYAAAVERATGKLRELGATQGQATFKTISDQLLGFTGGGAEVTAALSEIEDILNGVQGLSGRARLEKFGADVLANTKSALTAQVDQMKALRQSAADELRAVAQFWSDEADRRMDFTERMAARTKPVLDTIDQLNKDLGPGFDQRRRAEEARALKARFDEETARMQREEDKRISRLRPPTTPTLDKIISQYGSLEAFDAAIAKTQQSVSDVLSRIANAIEAFLLRVEEAERLRLAFEKDARDEARARQMRVAAVEGRSIFEVPGAETLTPDQIAAMRNLGGGPGGALRNLDQLPGALGTLFNSWIEDLRQALTVPRLTTVDVTSSDGSLQNIDPQRLEPALNAWLTGVATDAQDRVRTGGGGGGGTRML
jgi:hypothetical protein